MAHTAEGAIHYGIEERSSPPSGNTARAAFHRGQRVAPRFRARRGSVPNDVTDEMFSEMRKHWSENQIVEIAAVVAYFGFLNRWKDTMERRSKRNPSLPARNISLRQRWKVGKHARK